MESLSAWSTTEPQAPPRALCNLPHAEGIVEGHVGLREPSGHASTVGELRPEAAQKANDT